MLVFPADAGLEFKIYHTWKFTDSSDTTALMGCCNAGHQVNCAQLRLNTLMISQVLQSQLFLFCPFYWVMNLFWIVPSFTMLYGRHSLVVFLSSNFAAALFLLSRSCLKKNHLRSDRLTGKYFCTHFEDD